MSKSKTMIDGFKVVDLLAIDRAANRGSPMADFRFVEKLHYASMLEMYYEDVVALNQAALPKVSDMDGGRLRMLARQACYFKAVVAGDREQNPSAEVAAFLLALAAGASYDSENYAWFSARYERFVYIDRVVVADARIGRGIGRRLYEDLRAYAGGVGAPCIACEVNTLPPNPESAAFHRRMGFAEVGKQRTEGGSKEVARMIKAL